MSIRRRRRKLTTLLGRMEQRVRSVELRPISLLTSSEIEAAVEVGAPATSPETVVGAAAPWQFKKVQDGYIYPKALTGLSEDRVELYTEADTGAEVNDRIEVSGIHWASSEPIDVTSDNFTVKNIDEPSWSGRPSYKHDPTQDQLAGVTISHAYEFKPETAAPQTWSSRRRLQTRRKVDSFEISAVPNSTVTLTMNATHHFEIGDIIFVGISSESSAAYGSDGLFEITDVTGTTIEYVLSAGVDTPVSSTDVSSADVYVFPVIREWAQDGSIWVNSSNNTTYYWDGIRWVEYTPTSDVGQDGDPPAPPSGLSITSEAALFGANYQAYAKVSLAWTAPTLTAAGETLTDLAGYKIRWRRSTLEDWREKQILNPLATSYTFDDDVVLAQNTFYYFELYAYDSGQQLSTAATGTHTTAQSEEDHTVYPPSAPVLTSRLGTITVSWGGTLSTGLSTLAAPSNIQFMNVYLSTSSGFTPSSSNFHERVRVFGSDGGFTVLTDLTYGTSYYVKITVIDSAGVESDASAQATAQVQPLVDADIASSALANWPFNGGTIPAGALASGAINASNMFGNDVVVQSAIAANAIGANEIAAGAIIAGKIGANAVTAATIAAGSITAGKIATNAVEADKINAGAITTVKLDANAVTANKIDSGAITADKLESNLVLSDLIIVGDEATGSTGDPGRIEIRGETQANPGIVAFKNGAGGATNATFRLYTGNGRAYLSETFVDGDITLDGGTIRTDAVGSTRVEIQDSTPAVDFYSGSTRIGRIGPYSTGVRIYGSGSAYLTVTAGTVNAENCSFTADGISSTQRLAQSIWANTGTGSFTVNRNSGGQLVPTTSDSRLKTDVASIDGALNKINQLNPVTFRWTAGEAEDVKTPGLIAQEVANVFSEDELFIVWSQDDPNAEGEFVDNPIKSIEYVNLIPHLIKAVQELSQKNSELEARIATLEGN